MEGGSYFGRRHDLVGRGSLVELSPCEREHVFVGGA